MSSTYSIKMTRDMLEMLSPKGSNRFSALEAFTDLTDKSAAGEMKKGMSSGGKEAHRCERQVAVTISGLAKTWNWNREKVRNYLLALEKAGAIKVNIRPKAVIISMDCMDFDTSLSIPRFPTEDERKLNRWICGYMTLEEQTESIMQFVSDTEDFLHGGGTNTGNLKTGERLHKLISHIIVHETDMIPSRQGVLECLEELFNEQCSQDFSLLLLYLLSAGLEGISQECPDIPFSHCELPLKVTDRLRIISEYYASYITPKRKECATVANHP